MHVETLELPFMWDLWTLEQNQCVPWFWVRFIFSVPFEAVGNNV